MAEHSTVNRRVAGSSPAWGVFSIIRARISFKPFFNACFRSSIVGIFFAPNCTDFLLLFGISALVLYQSFYLYM